MVNSNQNENIDVMVFENPEFGPVRTFKDKDGTPYFCGKDVCKALGYRRADNAIRQHVNDLDALKQCIKVPGSLRKDGTRTMRSQEMLFVNESGVYSLVFGSKLESARQFKHWVTSEVLPAIRKNGGYFHINPGETVERIQELDKTVGDQMVRLQKSAEEILSQEAYIDSLLPKSLYTDNVLDSISCYTTTQIAKDTQGCILVGENRKVGMVVNSRFWMNRLMKKFENARDKDEAVFITIE